MPEVENFHRSKDRVTACLVHLRGLPEALVSTVGNTSFARAPLLNLNHSPIKTPSADGKSSRPPPMRQIISGTQEPSRAAVIFQLTPRNHHLTKPRKLPGAADSPALELRTISDIGVRATS